MGVLTLALCAAFTAIPQGDSDGDRDGLSDFQELHKYGTDPEQADSDGDGIPDGDWFERREYAYTVRTVVHVMKPVTLEHLNDDYQDARLLDDAGDWVELEVVHYPFNSVAEAIEANPRWRRVDRDLKPWLEPGPTSDWDAELRKGLTRALAEAGIDVDELSDREVVEQVSSWLMEHARHEDGFTSFITSFDEHGRPYVEEELAERAERGVAEEGRSLEEQWVREVSAKGMFEHGVRGSCTSSAIYISGCMRAVGIPTRTVLCIPLIDASDAHEHELAASRLTHPKVKRIVTEAAAGSTNSWTSHTFNEVYVGGRWRRLNDSKLGQNILDSHYLGLMTHVATFHDWADADMPSTVGRRQSLSLRADVFGGTNPYSTISIRDEYGVHCELPRPGEEELSLTVERVHWTDDPELPADILQGCEERGRFGLIAVVSGVEGQDEWRSFLDGADTRVSLEAPGEPELGVGFERGCWWYKNGSVFIYLPFGQTDRRDLREGVVYSVRARNEETNFLWDMELEIAR